MTVGGRTRIRVAASMNASQECSQSRFGTVSKIGRNWIEWTRSSEVSRYRTGRLKELGHHSHNTSSCIENKHGNSTNARSSWNPAPNFSRGCPSCGATKCNVREGELKSQLSASSWRPDSLRIRRSVLCTSTVGLASSGGTAGLLELPITSQPSHPTMQTCRGLHTCLSGNTCESCALWRPVKRSRPSQHCTFASRP